MPLQFRFVDLRRLRALDPARMILRFATRSLAVTGLAVFSAAASAAAPSVKEFFGNHCTDCHDAEEKKGGLDLESLKWEPGDPANFVKWVRINDFVAKDEMPPKKRKERPEADEVHAFLGGLGKELTAADVKREAAGGRTVLRRLNRTEYERTLHDLLGISTPLAVMLPGDTPMHGFDTVAEGLRISTLQMEKDRKSVV